LHSNLVGEAYSSIAERAETMRASRSLKLEVASLVGGKAKQCHMGHGYTVFVQS